MFTSSGSTGDGGNAKTIISPNTLFGDIIIVRMMKCPQTVNRLRVNRKQTIILIVNHLISMIHVIQCRLLEVLHTWTSSHSASYTLENLPEPGNHGEKLVNIQSSPLYTISHQCGGIVHVIHGDTTPWT